MEDGRKREKKVVSVCLRKAGNDGVREEAVAG